MSAVAAEHRLREAVAAERSDRGLTLRAKLYFAAVAAVTLAVAAPPIARIDGDVGGWTAFLVLAACAATVQIFGVTTTRNQTYHTAIVFLVAGALLLPPELLALMGIVQHVPEWLKMRYAWYIQTFNICNFTIAALAASAVFRLVEPSSAAIGEPQWAFGALAACVVFVALNHLLLVPMLVFARGHRPRETGLLAVEYLATDLVIAGLGAALAAFSLVNPWLVAFGIAPLILIHRSLHVPRLQEQARVDPKTGLFNARHFADALGEEVARAERFDRPLSLIMADLDLLRDINNTYGHLAGDAVLVGIADEFRAHLRHYDLPSRFGGEEFAILLPETSREQALEIAERIRQAVGDRDFEVETSSEPIRATISMGIASFPQDARDPNELVHQADLAVYRAKLQGRNRILCASSEPLLERQEPLARLVPLAAKHAPPRSARGVEPAPCPRPAADEGRHPVPSGVHGTRFFSLSSALAAVVVAVAVAGLGAGVLGLAFGSTTDVLGLVAIVMLVGIGQALALEVDDGSISVGAVGAITAASLFGGRAALVVAATSALVEWSARRSPAHHVVFNIATLTLASLAATGVFEAAVAADLGRPVVVAAGILAGGAYFLVNTGLLTLALAAEGRQRPRAVWHERFAWLLPHYLVYGLVGGVLAVGYHAAGLYALLVSAVPLLLMRRTQAQYLAHTQRNAQKLREAAETIQSQNVSLERVNRLLKERSTAAMESLSATVDARDSYTAGHSRRVQRIALSIGRELGLSQPELDLLGHAALFHDIGKLAIPDEVLLKPARLSEPEWGTMRQHADEGARIIDRLGFLADAVPAIRHHHERYDGSGYPDGLSGDDIPLGARIIHVADAFDSMLTTRTYRRALSLAEALAEVRRGRGTQFCPRCVAALERVLREAHEKVPAPELLAS